MQYGSRTDLGYVVLQHDISDPHGLRSQVGSLRHTSTGWVRWASMFTSMVLERKLDHLGPGTCSTSFTCFYAAEIVSILGQGHLVSVSVCWNGTLLSQDKLQVLAFQACGPPWFKAWEFAPHFWRSLYATQTWHCENSCAAAVMRPSDRTLEASWLRCGHVCSRGMSIRNVWGETPQ